MEKQTLAGQDYLIIEDSKSHSRHNIFGRRPLVGGSVLIREFYVTTQ